MEDQTSHNDRLTNAKEEKDNSSGGKRKKDEETAGRKKPSLKLPVKKWIVLEGKQFTWRFLRSFAKAAAIYAGVRTFTAFMKNPFRQGVPKVWQSVVSKDCVRFAVFLGLYPSMYHLILSVLHRCRRQKDGWNYSIAGGLAGLSLAVEESSCQKTFAFFTAARALGAGVTTLVTRGVVPHVPHAETLTFCVCCGALLTCVTNFSHLLPQSYYHSVVKWSRDYTDAILNVLFRTPGDRFLACSEAGLHTGTCTRHAVEDFLRSLPGFAKLYLPIHLVPILLFKMNRLKTTPQYVLTSLIKNLTMSTLFLSCMVFLAKYVICLLRNASGRPPPLPTYIPFIAGLTCGLSVLWERVSRRKELVLFLIPQLLNVAFTWAKTSRWTRDVRVPHGFVLMFATSMAVVMHAYEREPASLALLMAGVLRFFVGDRQRNENEKKDEEGKMTQKQEM